MSLSYDRNGTNEYRRVLPRDVVSAKRHRDGLDRLREAADSALAVLLGFGGGAFWVLLLGRWFT